MNISDLKPDKRNLNKHSERGSAMVKRSLEKNGFGRSILIDKDGQIIAGNLTVEEAGQIGLEDVVVVPSDGTKIIAVQRTDVSLDSPQGRELALADNRTAEVSLTWDKDELIQLQEEGLIELTDYFSEIEQAHILYTPVNVDDDGGSLKMPEDVEIPSSDIKQILLLFPGDKYQTFIECVAKIKGRFEIQTSTDAVYYAIMEYVKTL